MANATEYLSHTSDLPSKFFWVQGESSHKHLFFSVTSSIGLIITRSQKPSSCACVCVLVTQSCPTLCDPTTCSPPGFSVHGILQARILEWIVIPFSRGSSQPKDRTLVSCITGRFFTVRATGKSSSCLIPPLYPYYYIVTKRLHLWASICILTHQKLYFCNKGSVQNALCLGSNRGL